MALKSSTQPEPRGIHVRPAQLGDICILLEPKRCDEKNIVQQRQRDLQSRFGGKPIEHVHLTCQRFACQDNSRIEVFASSLEQALATVEPFPLTALSLETLNVPVRETNILKWRVQVTDELRNFAAIIESALGMADLASLYVPGFTSSLVAALKNITELDADRLSSYRTFPHHLFTAEQVVLSKIEGANRFKILAALGIGT